MKNLQTQKINFYAIAVKIINLIRYKKEIR